MEKPSAQVFNPSPLKSPKERIAVSRCMAVRKTRSRGFWAYHIPVCKPERATDAHATDSAEGLEKDADFRGLIASAYPTAPFTKNKSMKNKGPKKRLGPHRKPRRSDVRKRHTEEQIIDFLKRSRWQRAAASTIYLQASSGRSVPQSPAHGAALRSGEVAATPATVQENPAAAAPAADPARRRQGGL